MGELGFVTGNCEHCGSTTNSADERCFNCGYRIPNIVITESELREWAAAEFLRLINEVDKEAFRVSGSINGNELMSQGFSQFKRKAMEKAEAWKSSKDSKGGADVAREP